MRVVAGRSVGITSTGRGDRWTSRLVVEYQCEWPPGHRSLVTAITASSTCSANSSRSTRRVATVDHAGVGVDAVLGEYGGRRLDQVSFHLLIAGIGWPARCWPDLHDAGSATTEGALPRLDDRSAGPI